MRATALGLIHLMMVVGLEAGHTDRFFASGSGQEALRSHDCGGTERHIALDHIHGCLACVYQLQHIGIARAAARVDEIRQYAVICRPASSGLPTLPSLHHSGLRGPPFA